MILNKHDKNHVNPCVTKVTQGFVVFKYVTKI